MPGPKPITLVAELTYKCPLRCPYCSNPLDCGDGGYRDELDTSQWATVFRQARDLGVLQLGLSGGEPLLRKDLCELVRAAADAGLYTTLVTAATLLTPELASGLKDAGLDHVQISIQDSDAEVSDRLAGTRSFETKLEAARLVKKLEFPLTLNFVLHRQNLDSIVEILELAERLEADRIELANTQYNGWALHNRAALMPTPEQLERAERVVEEARARIGPRMDILWVLPDYFEKFPKPCSGGWGLQAMVVAPNGDVMPCHGASVIPELDFANVRDHDLAWIWSDSQAFNRFRGTDWMPEPCQSCDRREIDFGGCRCQAFLLTGNASATDPVCHLSPDHHLVEEARKESRVELPLVYRSMRGAPAG